MQSPRPTIPQTPWGPRGHECLRGWPGARHTCGGRHLPLGHWAPAVTELMSPWIDGPITTDTGHQLRLILRNDQWQGTMGPALTAWSGPKPMGPHLVFTQHLPSRHAAPCMRPGATPWVTPGSLLQGHQHQGVTEYRVPPLWPCWRPTVTLPRLPGVARKQ